MADDSIRLEVHIHSFADETGAFLVEVTSEPGNRSGGGKLRLDDLPSAEIIAAIDAMDAGALDSPRTLELGKLLFDTMFTNERAVADKPSPADVYAAARDDGPLRIHMIIDVERAQRVPWELMHDGERFLALSGPFARGITTIERADALKASQPLRVLVVDAYPVGHDKLSTQQEATDIEAALKDSKQPIEIVAISRVTPKKLQNALREAAAEPDPRPFHVLHFIGHGRHDAADGKSVLLFEKNEERDELPVTPTKLLNYIAEFQLKLVFLNACQSVETSSRQTAETFSDSLLESGIPAVIGMQTSVYDRVAREFAEEFYEAIADNRPVDYALADARRLVHDTDDTEASNLGVPVCYLRNKSGQILDLQPAKEPVPWYKRLWQGVGVFALLLGLVLGLLEIRDRLQGPGEMNPLDFNVAVATIEAGPGVENSLAEGLTTRIFDQVNTEMATIGHTAVWSPEKTGGIGGDTPDARAASAEDLADDINADVILYGTLTNEGGIANFQPEFFVNDRRLGGATELIGPYRFGPAERFVPDSLAAVAGLEAKMASRATALAQFVISLSAYADTDYSTARDGFERAAEIDGWEDDEGKEIVHLFLGNTSGRLREYAEAALSYEEALRVRPDYARALVGKAEITFQQSRGDCSTTFSESGLADSADEFKVALDAEFQPPLADIDMKVAYGLGRVYLCQHIAGLASQDPVAEFSTVIAAAESGNDRLDELAWESHANLGLYYRAVSPFDLDRAIVEYQRAIDLIDASVGGRLGTQAFRERKAVFYSSMAEVMALAGREAEAIDAYETAIELSEDPVLLERLRAELRAVAGS